MSCFHFSFRAVNLKSMVRFRARDDDKVIQGAAPGLVRVDGVITGIPDDRVLHIHRAAKPFDTVILIGNHLDVFNHCSVAYTAQGQAVDFVALAYIGTTVSNGDVFKYPRIVLRIIASIESADITGWNPFNLEV